jgi:hypothetical protein
MNNNTAIKKLESQLELLKENLEDIHKTTLLNITKQEELRVILKRESRGMTLEEETSFYHPVENQVINFILLHLDDLLPVLDYPINFSDRTLTFAEHVIRMGIYMLVYWILEAEVNIESVENNLLHLCLERCSIRDNPVLNDIYCRQFVLLVHHAIPIVPSKLDEPMLHLALRYQISDLRIYDILTSKKEWLKINLDEQNHSQNIMTCMTIGNNFGEFKGMNALMYMAKEFREKKNFSLIMKKLLTICNENEEHPDLGTAFEIALREDNTNYLHHAIERSFRTKNTVLTSISRITAEPIFFQLTCNHNFTPDKAHLYLNKMVSIFNIVAVNTGMNICMSTVFQPDYFYFPEEPSLIELVLNHVDFHGRNLLMYVISKYDLCFKLIFKCNHKINLFPAVTHKDKNGVSALEYLITDIANTLNVESLAKPKVFISGISWYSFSEIFTMIMNELGNDGRKAYDLIPKPVDRQGKILFKKIDKLIKN